MAKQNDFIRVVAIDKNSSDTMGRNFSTTFRGEENEFMLRSMVSEWEKEIPYGRYELVTEDDIEEYSEEIQEVINDLEISN